MYLSITIQTNSDCSVLRSNIFRWLETVFQRLISKISRMKEIVIFLLLIFVCNAKQIITDPSFEKTLPDGVSEYWSSFSNPKHFSPFCDQNNSTECYVIEEAPGAHTGHWYFWFAGYGFRNSQTQLWFELPNWTCKVLMRLRFWITMLSTGEDQSVLSCSMGKMPILSFRQSDTVKYPKYTMIEQSFWLEDCFQESNSLLFIHEGFSNEDANITHYFIDDVTLDVYYRK
jgi:hypothetical protein